MTLPIGTRVRVRKHWLVEGFTGSVVDHRKGDLGSATRNDVLLDQPWVKTCSPEPEFCRRLWWHRRWLTERESDGL